MESNIDYRMPIINYLKEKYGCDFEVKQITKEFNGLDGSYFRAICKSETCDEAFEVYCYLDSEKSGDRIVIDKKNCKISDNYANVLFGDTLKSKIEDRIGSEIFLKCQVKFSNHFLTDEELKAGLQDCMKNTELYSHVTVYVIAKNEIILESVRKKVEEICLDLNAYRQYLYFAVASDMNLAEIQNHFDINEETFDQHINECDLINKVFFSLLKRDEGITKRTIERE